jgi:hypothetical protein
VRRNLNPTNKTIAAGLKPTLELFDLATDRAEEHDVSATHPDIVSRLMQMMKAQHTPSKEFPFAALDP